MHVVPFIYPKGSNGYVCLGFGNDVEHLVGALRLADELRGRRHVTRQALHSAKKTGGSHSRRRNVVYPSRGVPRYRVWIGGPGLLRAVCSPTGQCEIGQSTLGYSMRGGALQRQVNCIIDMIWTFP